MLDEDFHVYMMPLPGDINAIVRLDSDGYPSIYINDYLSPQAKKRAFIHELRHIRRDDLYNSLPLCEAERD